MYKQSMDKSSTELSKKIEEQEAALQGLETYKGTYNYVSNIVALKAYTNIIYIYRAIISENTGRKGERRGETENCGKSRSDDLANPNRTHAVSMFV